ncbi:hypothetical protein [Actinopolyspora erythraea]|uniref:hypothetical protein n=1 Tax=Actinopolyspora erythraea TaxID=414996 RepID=UPI000B29AE5C|nr:hypothetical protein [Actinopolyspora erythraea]
MRPAVGERGEAVEQLRVRGGDDDRSVRTRIRPLLAREGGSGTFEVSIGKLVEMCAQLARTVPQSGFTSPGQRPRANDLPG